MVLSRDSSSAGRLYQFAGQKSEDRLPKQHLQPSESLQFGLWLLYEVSLPLIPLQNPVMLSHF